jgi:predicted lactoylglutathione lyase
MMTMTSTQTAPGSITWAVTAPTPRKLFVNVLVQDLDRSMAFFSRLGFAFNRQFTDATAAAMLVGEDAYFMLLTPEKFGQFVRRPIGDPKASTTGIFAVSVESRAAVDEMVRTAVAAGGSHALDPQDHGFMYGWSFYDLDGHHWEVFWMDPSVVQQNSAD